MPVATRQIPTRSSDPRDAGHATAHGLARECVEAVHTQIFAALREWAGASSETLLRAVSPLDIEDPAIDTGREAFTSVRGPLQKTRS
jgi:hypothetical protein